MPILSVRRWECDTCRTTTDKFTGTWVELNGLLTDVIPEVNTDGTIGGMVSNQLRTRELGSQRSGTGLVFCSPCCLWTYLARLLEVSGKDIS